MTPEIRSHIRRQTVSNIVINVLLNGLIAWWLLHDKPPLSAWGDPGYGADMLATGFLLAGILAAFMIRIHRGHRDKGVLAPIAVSDLGLVARLPASNIWLASGLFGVLGMLASAAVVFLLVVAALPPLPTLTYVVFKSVWAGILAGLVVPPAIRVGLRAAG